jgi:hypothetical protein
MFESVNTFLAFIKSLHSELRSLNNNLEKHSEAIDKATDATKEFGNKAPEVRAILNFPESVQASKEAANAREQRYQNRNLLLGLVTLISLVIYAITTIFIYCASNKAANAAKESADAAKNAVAASNRQAKAAEDSIGIARDAMRLQQRPWVGIDDAENALQTTAIRFNADGNAHMGYRIQVKNFSNSAAQNVLPVVVLMITEDIESVRARERSVCENYVNNSDFGNTIFPGRQRLSAQSSSLAQRSEMRSSKGKFEAWLVGCIGYKDSFGHLYHTGFIYWLTDPKTTLGFEFDATPNREVTGHWATWRGFVD